MSANISEIMFEMESAGMSKDRVAEIVVDLLRAGRATLLAAVGEIAGHHVLSESEFELTVANLVALSSRTDGVGMRDAALEKATWFS